VSDLDPFGLDLQRSWQEALDNFDAPVFGPIVRIGLIREQVEAIPDCYDARARQHARSCLNPSSG